MPEKYATRRATKITISELRLDVNDIALDRGRQILKTKPIKLPVRDYRPETRKQDLSSPLSVETVSVQHLQFPSDLNAVNIKTRPILRVGSVTKQSPTSAITTNRKSYDHSRINTNFDGKMQSVPKKNMCSCTKSSSSRTTLLSSKSTMSAKLMKRPLNKMQSYSGEISDSAYVRFSKHLNLKYAN